MTIAKAIEILNLEEKATLPPRDDDFWRAIRQGVMALKHVATCESFQYQAKDELSPGVTED